jgi:hypothetical protein
VARCPRTPAIPTEGQPGILKSCLEILQKGESVGDGVYLIDPNGGNPADAFSAYCDMTTDGGGWTLIEMASASLVVDSTYWASEERNPEALLDFASKPNDTARLSATRINEICKGGDGYVRSRYAYSAPGYMITDWFSPSILPNLDIAKMLRGTASYQAGFSDFGNGSLTPRTGGDWRRYNGFLTDNLECTGIHSYCGGPGVPLQGHGPLCDTYGCDKPGQRTVEGHMWWSYPGRTGVPHMGYGQYYSWGSRWCR